MGRPSIVTVVFWGSMIAAALLTLVLPSQGATLAFTIAAPLIVVLLAIVVTLVLGRRAAKGRAIGARSSIGTLWTPAPRYVYAIIVLGTALTWTMFGMHLGPALEVWDAGGTPEPLQRLLIGLWLLMGVADVWWLFRARATPVGARRGESAPAI